MADKFECKYPSCRHSYVYEGNMPQTCPKCGSRSFTITMGHKMDRGHNEDSIRWSESMGCSPEEIPVFMKLYPGSEYHPETGALKTYNYKHQKREAKRRGYSILD